MNKRFKYRRYLNKQLKEFAQEFQAIRLEKQMTEERVAALCKVSPDTIKNIEQGVMDIKHSLFYALCMVYRKKIHMTLVDKK